MSASPSPTRSTANKVVQLGVAPNRIDFMTAIDGIDFQAAWTNRVSGLFGFVPVFYLGRSDFVRNKQAAGRAQDLADIEALDGEWRGATLRAHGHGSWKSCASARP